MSDTYSHYTPKDFDVYVNNMIGSYKSKLEGRTFTDRRQTSYLEVLKYNAELIWEECNTPKLSLGNVKNWIDTWRSELEKMKQDSYVEKLPGEAAWRSYLEVLKYNADLIKEECNTSKQSLVNTDVLNTVLLSLHPASLLKDKDISNNTRSPYLT